MAGYLVQVEEPKNEFVEEFVRLSVRDNEAELLDRDLEADEEDVEEEEEEEVHNPL
jgi:hypothetical protein